LEQDDNEWATLLVNICKRLWSHACLLLAEIFYLPLKPTELSKSLECSGGAERARVGNAQHGNQDHGIEDGWKNLDTSKFDGNDERRVTRLTASIGVKWAVGWDNETNEEEIDNVEDADTPDDLVGGLGDFLAWVTGLGSSETSEFGSGEGKRGCDEDGTESVEAIEESRVWSFPVHMSVVLRYNL
jgi:hypothetical protein